MIETNLDKMMIATKYLIDVNDKYWCIDDPVKWSLDNIDSPLLKTARIALLSLTRYVRWQPLGLLSVGAGLINDQALKQRAGGNRQGQTIQASAQHDLPHGQIQAQWSQTLWISAQDFFPGLVNERRQNRTKQLTLTYQRKLSAQISFYVQYQHRTAQDTVPLYAYTLNDLVGGWVLKWR